MVENDGTVVSIEKGKKRDGIMPALLFRDISDAINRWPASELPPFPVHYRVVEPELGARIILKIEPDLSVSMVKKEAVQQDILRYTQNQLAGRKGFPLTHAQAKEAMLYWRAVADPIHKDDIKAVRWLDEDGLTYRRLPWPKGMNGHTPTWDAILARTTNAEAFRHWIGSLFFEDSYLHQYVWCMGFGNDGKGAINTFLKYVFGQAYGSKQPPKGDTRFWAYTLQGKRLVSFAECDDHRFPASGLFKTLTGGDPIEVEAKGEMSFTTTINCKFLFLSNERPSLSSETADTRRIIYCEFEKRQDQTWDAMFEQKLWDEGGDFLGRCVSEYEATYPQHGPIKTDNSAIQDHIDLVEMGFEEFFEFHFEVDQSETRNWVSAAIMQRLVERKYRTWTEKIGFYAWLRRKHGVKSTAVRSVTETGEDGFGRVYKGWRGLVLKVDGDAISQPREM